MSIIQSPELLVYKKIEASRRVGEYFVALAVFKNGLVFGSKFSERQSRPGQWLMQNGPASIVGGIGDLSDFKNATFALNNFCQHISGVVGERYLTGAGIVKFLSNLLRQAFEERACALAVNFIVADCQDENTNEPDLWFVDFDGSVKQLRNFAVAGGAESEKPLTEEEVKNLSPKEQGDLELQKANFQKQGIPQEFFLNPIKLYFPRKAAIACLEKNWKKNMKKEEAVEVVKRALFECNPESREKIIEIVVIEYGKDPVYFLFKK